MDKSKVESIQIKIKKALEIIEKEENIKISFGTIRYNRFSYNSSVKIISLEDTDEIESFNESICKSLGFTQNIVGMTFEKKSDNIMKSYIITEVIKRNRKYPIITKSIQDGKSYKFPVESVRSLLGGDKIINRNYNLNKIVD